jgi:hypothetical protein
MPSETTPEGPRLRPHSHLTQPAFILTSFCALAVLIIFCISASAVARTLRFYRPIEYVHWSVLYTLATSVISSVFFTIQCAFYKNYAIYTPQHRIGFWVVFVGNFLICGAYIAAIAVSSRSDYARGVFYVRLAFEVMVAAMAALLSIIAGLKSFCKKEPPSLPNTELERRQRDENVPSEAADPERVRAARESLIRIHNELNSPAGSTRRNREQ